jgi:prepilin-type N-terminal cleavage/methylation domain-containing protein/prepilin-type processing-associated H-X9-DG protein
MRHHSLHGKTSVHEPATGVPKPSAAPASLVGGFTLTELLVVVAILAILAAIAIPFTSKAIDSSQRATCVTQLRQIGVATGSYLADNNNRLPGPIHANGQLPNYRSGSTAQIFSCLHTYLGLPSTNQWTAIPKKLCCPAFQRRNPQWNSNGQGDQGGRAYSLNQDQRVNGKRVFGMHPSSGPQEAPLSFSAVASGNLQTPLSKLPMIGDFGDVHGSVRNILFFDFHVEAMPLDYGMNNLP